MLSRASPPPRPAAAADRVLTTRRTALMSPLDAMATRALIAYSTSDWAIETGCAVWSGTPASPPAGPGTDTGGAAATGGRGSGGASAGGGMSARSSLPRLAHRSRSPSHPWSRNSARFSPLRWYCTHKNTPARAMTIRGMSHFMSVPSVSCFVIPCVAGRYVSLLDVAETPADLRVRVRHVVGPGGRHLGSGQG